MKAAAGIIGEYQVKSVSNLRCWTFNKMTICSLLGRYPHFGGTLCV